MDRPGFGTNFSADSFCLLITLALFAAVAEQDTENEANLREGLQDGFMVQITMKIKLPFQPML